jgi:VIT1/CCC1 family predicted Fe2+/Mn2+ transporter
MQGWNIDHIGQWSSVVMTFNRSEPKKDRYIYDAQVFPKKEYKPTYEQFGWEFVGQMASCYIWRKEYFDKRPESFTNHESLETRNKQVVSAVSVSFAMFSIVSIILITAFIITFSNLTTNDMLQLILAIVLSFVFALYLGYVMKKIYKNRFK